MENPATWGKAEQLVNEIIRWDVESRGEGQFRAGYSLARQITDALRAEGLLVEEEDNSKVL